VLHICRACECDGDHRSAHIKSVSFPFWPELYKTDDRYGMFHVHVSSTYTDAFGIPRDTHRGAPGVGGRRLRNARSDSQATRAPWVRDLSGPPTVRIPVYLLLAVSPRLSYCNG
jgi:hypothetical protein